MFITRPPQIAASGRLSSRHLENTLKMAGTFRKRPITGVLWQAQNQFVEAYALPQHIACPPPASACL